MNKSLQSNARKCTKSIGSTLRLHSKVSLRLPKKDLSFEAKETKQTRVSLQCLRKSQELLSKRRHSISINNKGFHKFFISATIKQRKLPPLYMWNKKCINTIEEKHKIGIHTLLTKSQVRDILINAIKPKQACRSMIQKPQMDSSPYNAQTPFIKYMCSGLFENVIISQRLSINLPK